MAGKSDIFEADMLKLIFNAVAITGIADNAATGALANLFIALHTADPQSGATEGSAQTLSEATYGTYARVPVPRSVAGWTVTTDAAGITKAQPVNPITFSQSTTGTPQSPQILTHFSVGTASTGAGKILYAGAITPTISVSLGVQPVLGTGTSISED